MDRLEKTLCVADKFRCKTVSIPWSLWKNQNIKCRLKANIKSLHSMLEEKLRKKTKNIKIIRILVEDPQLIDYFMKLMLWWKMNFLNSFSIQKINSTFSKVHRIHRQIVVRIFGSTCFGFFSSKNRVEIYGAIWINSYNLKHKI